MNKNQSTESDEYELEHVVNVASAGGFRRDSQSTSRDPEIPQESIVAQITDVPSTVIESSLDVHAPHVMGEIVEVFELIPQERDKNCAVKQTDDQNTHRQQDNQLQVARQAAQQERERERERKKKRKGRKEEGKREREEKLCVERRK